MIDNYVFAVVFKHELTNTFFVYWKSDTNVEVFLGVNDRRRCGHDYITVLHCFVSRRALELALFLVCSFQNHRLSPVRSPTGLALWCSSLKEVLHLQQSD